MEVTWRLTSHDISAIKQNNTFIFIVRNSSDGQNRIFYIKEAVLVVHLAMFVIGPQKRLIKII